MFLESSKRRIFSRQHGFTLIEVMVSLAIFVIAIVGCYQLQLTSSLSNGRSNGVATASTWAQYVAEELLAREYKDNNATRTDPLLINSKGNANGLIDVDVASAAKSDGICLVQPKGLIVWPVGGVNPVPAATDLYRIFWNIVDNRPLKNVKQIRVIVLKNGGIGSGRLYTQDYFKLGPLD